LRLACASSRSPCARTRLDFYVKYDIRYGVEDASSSQPEEEVTRKVLKGRTRKAKTAAEARPPGKVKFLVQGEEMIDKKVMRSGASGRIYLPADWVDRHVKIVRID